MNFSNFCKENTIIELKKYVFDAVLVEIYGHY